MSGTQMAPIGSFCLIGSGTTPSRSAAERYYGGGIPWVKSGELRERDIERTEETVTEEALKETSLKLIPAGTLLVAMYGATVGRTGILRTQATTNQAICHIIPDKSVADTKYLFFALNYLQPFLVSQGVGGAQPNISQDVIRRTEVRLPPLNEQRRIADILDQADGLRHKRQEALGQLENYPSAILKESEAAGSADRITTCQLGELVRDDDRINYGVVQPGPEVEGGIPLIRVENVVNNVFDRESLKHISSQIEAQYRRSRLRGDEILVACVGSIGAVALATCKITGFNIARAVARIPIDPNKADRIYIASCLRQNETQAYFRAETRTVAQPTLNIKQLSETPLLLPPIDIQHNFAARIAKFDILMAHHRAHLAKLNTLFASLQHRAFRGEL